MLPAKYQPSGPVVLDKKSFACTLPFMNMASILAIFRSPNHEFSLKNLVPRL